LKIEYNTLSKEWDKKDKQIKDDNKVREKLESIKEQRTDQKKIIKGYTLRQKQLANLEQQVKNMQTTLSQYEMKKKI
jgi:hypothetical protein